MSTQTTFSSPFNSNQPTFRRLKKFYHEDDGYVDLQFQKPAPKVPWKAISLATILFIGGMSAITMSILTYGQQSIPSSDDGPLVLMVLGFLMFIPGFYHVRIAYYAFKEYPGYSYDDIPDFD